MKRDNLRHFGIGAQSGKLNHAPNQRLCGVWRSAWRALAGLLLASSAQAAPYPENLVQIRVWGQDGNYVTYDAVFVAIEIFDCGPGTDEPLDTYEVRVPETGIMLIHMAAGTEPDLRVRYDQRNYNANYLGTGQDVLHVYTIPEELITRHGFEAERCKRHWR